MRAHSIDLSNPVTSTPLEGTEKLVNCWGDHPHTQEGWRECNNYPGISLLSFPVKACAKCLEKCREIIEPKPKRMSSVVFVLAVALQSKFLISSIFSKYLGNMTKMFKPTHVLSTSRKHITRSVEKIFRECCGRTVLTTACYWPSSHYIPAQRSVFVSVELNHNRSLLVLDSDNGV